MEDKIYALEMQLKSIFPEGNFKIHRLKSETEEFLIVSKKEENNSYCFFKPLCNEKKSEESNITLSPIDNIFDYLEDNNVVMELQKEDNETEEVYGRNR